jgi:hypothetical protein
MSGERSSTGFEAFIDYVFRSRKAAVLRMIRGELEEKDVYLEFTRATPVVITNGPAGLSGSVKMLGFVPKEKQLPQILKRLKNIVGEDKGNKSFMAPVVELIYDENSLDFMRLGGLEMGFNHSWKNIRANGKATLLYYTPPTISYEVRCDVKIHERGLLYEYLNILHDLFHYVDAGKSSYPAYEFIIKEIYDQSATKEGFGKLIYKRE